MQNGEQALKSAGTIPRDIALGLVNRAKLAEWHNRQSCIRQAQTKPLPGAAGRAFASGPIKAGGHVVHRVVPAHFALLQALESPLLLMIENAMTQKAAEVDFKPAQQWDICHVFTEEAEKLYDLMETQGVKSVKESAKRSVGMAWDAAAVNLVMMAVLEQVKRHIETTVKLAGDMREEGQVSFFQEPPEKP